MNLRSLREDYKLYTRTVSPDYMSISWNLTKYLVTLLEKLEPRRILDLGSGWSSYLFRLLCPEVWTADHDERWLEKTRHFLERFGLDDDRLIMIRNVDWGLNYDFALVDNGPTMWGRPPLFDRLKDCADVICFDDADREGYNRLIREAFRGWRVEWLRVKTVEKHRFAAVAYRSWG